LFAPSAEFLNNLIKPNLCCAFNETIHADIQY
jgi:hypothetical protein